METNRTAKSRGRPRAFDADKALDQALRIFWKKGYEGASLPELTQAMGINRPSMYAAFGNKESLFRKALDRYMERSGNLWTEAMAQPTARQSVEHLLYSAIKTPGKVRGCLLVQGALACGESAEPIQHELALRRSMSESILKKRFVRAIKEGDLPASANASTLAKYIATFQQGIAVQMAGGANRKELLAAVDVALKAWPKR